MQESREGDGVSQNSTDVGGCIQRSYQLTTTPTVVLQTQQQIINFKILSIITEIKIDNS